MENNSIKKLAEQAKRRLARNGRLGINNFERQKTFGKEYDVKFLTEYNKINFDEDQKLFEKLKEILKENSNTTSPLGQLVDQKMFKSLSSIEKDKYIVKLVEKFQYFMQKIEKDNNFEHQIIS